MAAGPGGSIKNPVISFYNPFRTTAVFAPPIAGEIMQGPILAGIFIQPEKNTFPFLAAIFQGSIELLITALDETRRIASPTLKGLEQLVRSLRVGSALAHQVGNEH